jgi:ATP-binding cassette subfamily G (WHITE) protein 2 (SNQ2)
VRGFRTFPLLPLDGERLTITLFPLFSLLFNSFNAFAELPTQMMGRPILQKQVGYTLFRPAAFSLGTLLADMPFGALQILLFCMIIYL